MLINTPGGSTTNSYTSLVEANAYHDTRPQIETWLNASDQEKEAALIHAGRLLDSSFRWTGAATSASQAMSWPRIGMVSKNGFLIDSGVIPQQLKEAQAEFARQLIDADRTADDDAEKGNISSVKAGSVAVTFRSREANSNTIDLRDADLIRQGPEFDYLSRVIPDAVRNLLVPSWYLTATITRPIYFEAD